MTFLCEKRNVKVLSSVLCRTSDAPLIQRGARAVAGIGHFDPNETVVSVSFGEE